MQVGIDSFASHLLQNGGDRLSGTEAMKVLRADPATCHIPIIALSANAVPRDIAQALEAGFYKYLTKPIMVKQFMEALDVALALSQPAAGKASTSGRIQAASSDRVAS